MAFALIQQTPAQVTGTNPTASYGVTPTSGNLLVAVIGLDETTTGSLTNPAGWTQRAEKATGTSTGLVRILSRISNGTEGAVTFTDATSRTYCIELTEWSGNQPAGSEFDAASVGASGGTTSIQPGSITPALTGELLITVVHHFVANGGSEAVTSSYNLLDAATFTLAVVAYKIKTDALAENPTVSWLTNTSNNVAIQAAFKSVVPTLPPPFRYTQAVQRAATR